MVVTGTIMTSVVGWKIVCNVLGMIVSSNGLLASDGLGDTSPEDTHPHTLVWKQRGDYYKHHNL